MSDTLTLSGFGFDLMLAPDAGGGIARLDWNGLPLLRPALSGAVGARDPLGLSSFPMTPYVSRITGGVFQWGDLPTAIAPNMAGGSHPLHGVGWRKPWVVTHHSAHQVDLELRHEGDADWPWAFVTTQTFRLHADHVEHVIAVKSTDDRPFPSSLGPHPYFNAEGANVQFTSQAYWEISGESLPTHMTKPPLIEEISAGVGARSLDLDHCFEGWNGRAVISWPTHSLEIMASCAIDDVAYPCTRLQLYTPRSAAFFCLEPVTARCVAFGEADPLSLGVVELVDQTLSITTNYRPFSQG